MKIVHTADLHIGMETHGPVNPHTGLPRRLEDFLKALECIVDTAIEEHADLVVMAGDIYKNREPSPTHQRLFARQVLRLVQARIPVFLLAGNHDLPNAVSRATSIDIFRDLEVPGVTVARDVKCWTIDTASGPIMVSAIPWVTRSAVLSMSGANTMSSVRIDEELVRVIVGSALDLAEEVIEHRKKPTMQDAPSLLVAHVHAAEARDGAERLLTVGTDPLVPITSIALDTFDYVALGHIHSHQKLLVKPPAVYPGSIERVNFGEEKEEKVFIVAEVSRGHAEWEPRTLSARKFVTIDVPDRSGDPTEETLRQVERQRNEVADAVVRVRVKMSLQNQALFDESRVRAALSDAFWIAGINREVDRPIRDRIAGMTVEGRTSLELLDDYFAEKQIPETDRVRLREYATRLASAES
ncbi:MAG: nuclease SbcCD, subunit [Chloroflexi bacterium]|nr:nuclease SbcCD, subunit [Chloroflexota bacterium]